MEGGLGGFKYDFFDVMLDSIYADILCMALAYRMYHDIYIMTTRAQLSEEIRHADVGQAERWPRRILLSFAPSAAAAWHCERSRTPCKDGYMTQLYRKGFALCRQPPLS